MTIKHPEAPVTVLVARFHGFTTLPQMPDDVFEIGDLRLKSVAAEDELDNYDSTEMANTAAQAVQMANKAALQNNFGPLPDRYKEELGAMIEGVISETIQKTLNKVLPEMMERIIHEELKE